MIRPFLLFLFFQAVSCFAQSHLYFDIESFHNLNGLDGKGVQSSWLDIGVRNEFEKRRLSGQGEADFRHYFDLGKNSYSLSTLFVNYDDDSTEYAIGRKKLNWHENEKFWQLGHLNGLRNFKLFDEKREGLLGLHIKTKSGGLESQFFFSYFFVPSLNPALSAENGRITSPMRWERLPPESVDALGRDLPIHYEIKRPESRDIVLQKSLGGQLKYKWKSGNMSLFSIYKPENKLRINATKALSGSEDQRGLVVANPTVNHHIMYGAEFIQKVDEWYLRGGYTLVDPNARLGSDFDSISGKLEDERARPESDFFNISPSFVKESYLHLSVNYRKVDRSLSFHALNYLSDHEKGSDDFYSDTIKFSRAVGVKGDYIQNDKFSYSLSYRYDLKRSDHLLGGDLFYRPLSNIRLGVGLEFIRSPQEESYWSKYRAKDTIYTSLGYFF